jgi:hypothetical protein
VVRVTGQRRAAGVILRSKRRDLHAKPHQVSSLRGKFGHRVQIHDYGAIPNPSNFGANQNI